MASLSKKDSLIDSILIEIEQRSQEWADSSFSTIYFGGGTPSVLSIDEINTITSQIEKYHNIDDSIEFTLEANPDDLTPGYLERLKNDTKVNRLSIGIQSFHDRDLKFINRRHNGEQARLSILNTKKAGFSNITIDLIYGIPGLNNNEWEKNIMTFIELDIPHLAAYHLSIEPKTVFGVFQKRNKIQAIDEDISVQQYNLLTSILSKQGYEHYEISNFAKNGMSSKHNTAYWQGKKYIGIGPSAHSFDGNNRRWNISNNTRYCQSLINNLQDYYESENLSVNDRFNDYLLTSLRTIWGANLGFIKKEFGEQYYRHCSNKIEKYSDSEQITLREDNFRISEKGWLVSDAILSDFFYEQTG